MGKKWLIPLSFVDLHLHFQKLSEPDFMKTDLPDQNSHSGQTDLIQ